jgi:hypothetical protein
MEILWFILKIIGVIIALIVLCVIFYFKGKLESYSDWYNEHEVDK